MAQRTPITRQNFNSTEMNEKKNDAFNVYRHVADMHQICDDRRFRKQVCFSSWHFDPALVSGRTKYIGANVDAKICGCARFQSSDWNWKLVSSRWFMPQCLHLLRAFRKLICVCSFHVAETSKGNFEMLLFQTLDFDAKTISMWCAYGRFYLTKRSLYT